MIINIFLVFLQFILNGKFYKFDFLNKSAVFRAFSGIFHIKNLNHFKMIIKWKLLFKQMVKNYSRIYFIMTKIIKLQLKISSKLIISH